MSFNVDDYTITELMGILQLDEMDEEIIKEKTTYYTEKFKKNDPKLSVFFANLQTKLLNYIDQLNTHTEEPPNEYEYDSKQTEDWIKYQALPQENKNQKNKITDRSQKMDVFDSDHAPMKKEQLGINNTYNVEVAQDVLNPNLTNTTTRFINLDSQFRQSGGPDSTSTDYTVDLSDPLTNVLNLKLYSFQIPYAWYAIDEQYGNNYFWLVNKNKSFKITVPSGNYNATNLCTTIQTNCISLGFTNLGTNPIATYNSINGLITLNFNGWSDPDGILIEGINNISQFVDEQSPYLKFFDITENNTEMMATNANTCVKDKTLYFNTTFGWMMGYRTPTMPVIINGSVADAIAKLTGTKYFILIIDDYNQNHINNGLVSITEYSGKLDYPSYYNESFLCLREQQFITPNTSTNVNFNGLQNDVTYSLGNIPQVIPTAPRTLTHAQIYTINEIIKNRKMNTSLRPKAPNNSDTFSLIPIKYNGLNMGDMYVDYSGSLQDNPRIYFGPVNIERLRVRLLDDMGRTVNLHGVDWAITLISENLYQY